MVVRTRFTTYRLDKKLSAAVAAAAGNNLEAEYRAAAEEVGQIIQRRIMGAPYDFAGHKSEFAHQDVRVFRAQSGRWNVNLGWINPPEHAKERGSRGRLWYQYWDSGFDLFGNDKNPMPGIEATIDRREMLIDRIEDINYRYVRDLAKILD